MSKIAVIGAGQVGATTAYTLAISGLAEEIAVVDLNEALARGVAQLGGAADCLYAGIAGAGTPELARALRHEMEKWLPEVKRMEVASDAFNAMNGEIGLGNGLALIAGTGSSAFLRTEDGVLQIGGRGPLIDDGGSGYSVGRAVLNAAYRAMDGRGPETALIHAAEKRLGMPLRELFLKRIPEKRVQARFPEKSPVCGAVKTAALMNGQKDFEIREELPPCNMIN